LVQVKALQEKLALIVQVENLANELGAKVEALPKVIELEHKKESIKLEAPKLEAPKLEAPKLEAPKLELPKQEAAKQEQAEIVLPTVEQSAPVAEPVSKDAAGNSSKNPYASMQQGLQAYMSGKTDKALEFFKEARDLNPTGFDKTWTTMTSIPVYQVVGRDKYITEILFQK
jgi:hypothetical protein